MIKKSNIPLKMTIVVTTFNGCQSSETLSPIEARLLFSEMVGELLMKHSSVITRIDLYDNSNRLFKSYSQKF